MAGFNTGIGSTIHWVEGWDKTKDQITNEITNVITMSGLDFSLDVLKETLLKTGAAVSCAGSLNFSDIEVQTVHEAGNKDFASIQALALAKTGVTLLANFEGVATVLANATIIKATPTVESGAITKVSYTFAVSGIPAFDYV
ncbi:hypothetical protein R6I31_000043 [Vibrio cholerae]|uniref:hypothetical protein n=1 Tax=Vibrio cholerae TaxID=666 RepID=UPI001E402A31|nr:hypothetical protein [Vibrio cholerae]EJL6830119.1 hypothetical protein [Vibrio cholerae]EJL7007702.1 hypothetical protein [Vibrio cholerae]EKF9698725.1 hypothetical protein [Vibrio cholerae]ELS9243377.1 hypothetical protein [Vibrio cholerae]MCD1217624.1 hypothetical protein [Vibrio cholerae]